MLIMEIIRVQLRELKHCKSYIDRSIQSKILHFAQHDGQAVRNRSKWLHIIHYERLHVMQYERLHVMQYERLHVIMKGCIMKGCM